MFGKFGRTSFVTRFPLVAVCWLAKEFISCSLTNKTLFLFKSLGGYCGGRRLKSFLLKLFLFKSLIFVLFPVRLGEVKWDERAVKMRVVYLFCAYIFFPVRLVSHHITIMPFGNGGAKCEGVSICKNEVSWDAWNQCWTGKAWRLLQDISSGHMTGGREFVRYVRRESIFFPTKRRWGSCCGG